MYTNSLVLLVMNRSSSPSRVLYSTTRPTMKRGRWSSPSCCIATHQPSPSSIVLLVHVFFYYSSSSYSAMYIILSLSFLMLDVFVFILGLIGNCLVVAVVFRVPQMRTVTNYFIVINKTWLSWKPIIISFIRYWIKGQFSYSGHLGHLILPSGHTALQHFRP